MKYDETQKFSEMIRHLELFRDLPDEELAELLTCEDEDTMTLLASRARAVRENCYGEDVYLRGLIEFSSYCKNDCLYCGLRRSNKKAQRYRLTPEEILSCCERGHALGFRTFVLQSGEDPYWTDDILEELIRTMKARYPDSAVTLSLGERSEESFRRLFEAGADRYLLRHETADRTHYEKLHPEEMSFENRMNCLRILKKIGYQVGCGMMVGSPYQTTECLIRDLRFIQELHPEMVGIGPFIPHKDTPFGDCEAGSVKETLRLLSIVRLMLPDVLLPATTALGTVDVNGRERGLMAGANVVMPNLSPASVRDKYLLYDNKICTGDEAAECVRCLELRVRSVGYRISSGRGDHITRQLRTEDKKGG